MARLSLPLLAACFCIPGSFLSAQSDEMDAQRLVAISPLIAVVEIDSAPRARIEDASLSPALFKQRVAAKLVRSLKGSLPDEFLIENQEDSVMTAGIHLAFLRPLDRHRFILSSPASLRAIQDENVYWFPNAWLPLKTVIDEVSTILAKSK